MPRITAADFRKPTKVKRKRKPMTAEQKAAAAERLAKARAAKAKKNPTKSQRYHPAVYDPKTAPFKLEKVLEWHKYAKEQASSYKSRMRQRGLKPKEMQHISDRYHWWYGYVMDINWYLKHGDWISSFHGKEQQCVTLRYTVAP